MNADVEETVGHRSRRSHHHRERCHHRWNIQSPRHPCQHSLHALLKQLDDLLHFTRRQGTGAVVISDEDDILVGVPEGSIST